MALDLTKPTWSWFNVIALEVKRIITENPVSTWMRKITQYVVEKAKENFPKSQQEAIHGGMQLAKGVSFIVLTEEVLWNLVKNSKDSRVRAILSSIYQFVAKNYKAVGVQPYYIVPVAVSLAILKTFYNLGVEYGRRGQIQVKKAEQDELVTYAQQAKQQELKQKTENELLLNQLSEIKEKLKQLEQQSKKEPLIDSIKISSIPSTNFFQPKLPIIFAYGFRERITPFIPGDCLFSAIANTLGKHDADYYRALAVDMIRQNPEVYRDYIGEKGNLKVGAGLEEDNISYSNFNDYCNAIEKPLVWGGEPEIAALAVSLSKTIVVLSKGEKAIVGQKIFGSKHCIENDVINLNKIIFLGYADEHYVLVDLPKIPSHRTQIQHALSELIIPTCEQGLQLK
ncbi:MAG: hypothetical protein Tsb005_14710 [Gammaproteobacteria bacterium]